MYTKQMAIRMVRKRVKRSICVDMAEKYPETLSREQFEHLVEQLLNDDYFWNELHSEQWYEDRA